MNMASRNIANMHLFLEMKKKFPDLPEDTLRNYVFLYAEDQAKCVNLLQKESKTHFHTSQPFSDIHLFENKVSHKKSDYEKEPFQSKFTLEPTGRSPQENVVSSSYASLPMRPPNPVLPPRPKIQSAPTTPIQEKPPSSTSSHTVLCNYNNINNNQREDQMMFSTTKEHAILPPPREDVQPKQRHAVSLSITPSFPDVYRSAVSAATKPGRHTTSLNLQLQPYPGAGPYPLEISTIPTNLASGPGSASDFGSHLHISVGAQGATFTALRLQRPQGGEASFKISQQVSSQRAKNVAPVSHLQRVQSAERFDRYSSKWEADRVPSSRVKVPQPSPVQNLSAQTSFGHGFEASPDYMSAVKKHQLSQLNLVQEELLKEKNKLLNLKYDVNKLEQELVQRQEKENSSSYAELLKKMKEENRKLRVEVNCLVLEYDLHSKGQIPVGMTDEDVYSNLFTGPSDGLTFCPSDEECGKEENPPLGVKGRTSSEEEDEKNRWLCKNCTFANHPALVKCEICELPKSTGYLEHNSNYSLHLVPSSEGRPRRAVGSVQISVTHRRTPSKSVKLQLRHRMPR